MKNPYLRFRTGRDDARTVKFKRESRPVENLDMDTNTDPRRCRVARAYVWLAGHVELLELAFGLYDAVLAIRQVIGM